VARLIHGPSVYICNECVGLTVEILAEYERTTFVEVLSKDINSAVIRTPGRSYPALVIQRDSFGVLHERAKTVLEGIRACNCDNSKVVDDCEELFELLDARKRHYEETLHARGVTSSPQPGV
jgi:hypothetical protein